MEQRLGSRQFSPGTILSSAALAALAGGWIALRRRQNNRAMAGKVVVITGGSRGLGLALGREFGRHGARVVLGTRNEQELQEAKQKLQREGAARKVLTVDCDLRQPEKQGS